MDLSLDEIIKKKKVQVKPKSKQQPQKKQPQKQQQQQQRRRPAVAQGRVGDVREKINQRRNMQLRGQDARQRLMEKKRQSITDARQLLKPKTKPVEFLLPQKVIKNNLFRPPPPPTVSLEYEDVPRQRLGPEHRSIPVHVSARSQQPLQSYSRQPLPSRQQQQQVQRAPAYRDRSRSPPPARRSGVSQAPAVVQGFKVTIANLHPNVTREDIYELFSSVGAVKKCVLLRPGDAEVVYSDKEDAQAALRRYDRRELDGMPMKLRISSVGIKVSGGGGGGGGGSAPAVSERAVRNALFRSDSGRHHRPVNFQVAV